MPATSAITPQEAITAIRDFNPELLTMADTDRATPPVSLIAMNATFRGPGIGVIVHHTPELLGRWLDFLGLTADDLAAEPIGDTITARSAHTTWRGLRLTLATYDYAA